MDLLGRVGEQDDCVGWEMLNTDVGDLGHGTMRDE
jgi:hypothetical protein